MLKLEGNQNAIALRIVDYQFPETTEGYDANWLNIEFSIHTLESQWQICNPCLLTWDVLRLIKWLRKAAHPEKLPYKEFSGLENDFSINYRGKHKDQCRLQVTVRHGCIPFDVLEKEGMDKRLRLNFTLDADELNQMADGIENKINCFPPRGELGMKWLQIIREEEKRDA